MHDERIMSMDLRERPYQMVTNLILLLKDQKPQIKRLFGVFWTKFLYIETVFDEQFDSFLISDTIDF